MMERAKPMITIVADEEMEITMEDCEKNNDVPKGMVDKLPENTLNIEVGPAVATAQTEKMNIIASTVTKKRKKQNKKKYLG